MNGAAAVKANGSNGFFCSCCFVTFRVVAAKVLPMCYLECTEQDESAIGHRTLWPKRSTQDRKSRRHPDSQRAALAARAAGYLTLMTALVAYHVLDLAAVFRHLVR